MKLFIRLMAMAILWFIPLYGICAQEVTIIHSFAGPPSDGARPMNQGLITDGNRIYGMTQEGGSGPGTWGSAGDGVVFSLNPDGSDYSVLHSFKAPGGHYDSDGRQPFGGLTLDSINSKLYGMTCYGGHAKKGMIFSVNTDGSGYTYLYDFGDTAPNAPGMDPEGSLLLSGGKLYGMTSYGGKSQDGIVFSINRTSPPAIGTALHEFAGKPSDGSRPCGSLIMDGGKLYGMTQFGGTGTGHTFGMGVIFSMNVDGSGPTTILHNFTSTPSDGWQPQGSLVLDSATQTLYGTTGLGGASEKGTIFSVSTSGTNYRILHTFTGEPGDGENPGDVLLKDGTLYGLTGTGGTTGGGTLYSIRADGSGYTILHNFNDSQRDGPVGFVGPLLSMGNALYGMTYSGGAYYEGTVFSFGASAPQAEILLSGSRVKAGDRFEATFRLNESIDRAFTAYAVIIPPRGRMLNARTLSPRLAPAASNMKGLNAPFSSRLVSVTIPRGAAAGTYEVLVAFFDPRARITGRQDAFLEASGKFSLEK